MALTRSGMPCRISWSDGRPRDRRPSQIKTLKPDCGRRHTISPKALMGGTFGPLPVLARAVSIHSCCPPYYQDHCLIPPKARAGVEAYSLGQQILSAYG